jgi:hemolysin activation/secretion protein
VISKLPHTRSLYAFAYVALSILGPNFVAAQAVPDAGSVLRQIEEGRRNELPPRSESEFTAPPPLESLGGATVTVNEFRFVGNALLTSEELAGAVARYVGRPIDFTELQNAAIAVATAYRAAGWVVRAYLPQQDITNGAVTIQIVEAVFGAVRVEGNPRRVSTQRLEAIVRTAQAPGAPLNAASLDRGLLLINDLPGIAATGRLAAGERSSETDLVLAVEDGSPIDGSVTLDDVGGRFTGEARVIGSASLNDRLGIGDRADALLLHSEGSDYLRLAYSLPIGNRGWRIGANASQLGYDIITEEFAALDAHGTSASVGFEASYPLVRSRLRNLYMTFNADDRRFDNKSLGETVTHYSVQTAAFSLYGNVFDSWGRGGATTARLALTQGNVDLSGSPNEAIDAMTLRTAGGFQKVNLSLSRTQAITDRISLFLGAERQMANENLDSSEKVYLGGSQGVRAYPENEAGGSEGTLVTFEMRTRIAPNVSLTPFVDWGSARVNKHNDFIGATQRNSVDLQGAGIAVGWATKMGLSMKATLARRSGDNPNASLTGEDQDGSLVENRVWLQVSLPF